MSKITFVFKGGAGSGHYGHEGRPGKQGGSVPGEGGSGGGHADDGKFSSMSPSTFEASVKNKKEKMFHGEWSSSGKRGVYTYTSGGVKYTLTHDSRATDVENKRNPNLRESGLRNTVSLILERVAPAKFQNPNFSGVQVDRDIVQIYKKVMRSDDTTVQNSANSSVRKILLDKFGITTS